MTWAFGFAVLWLVVGSSAALVIGRGLRLAEKRDRARILVSGRVEVLPVGTPQDAAL